MTDALAREASQVVVPRAQQVKIADPVLEAAGVRSKSGFWEWIKQAF